MPVVLSVMLSPSLLPFSFLLIKITSASQTVKINGCSASINQEGYHCSLAYDGETETSKGWAMDAILPAWAIFTFEKKMTLKKIRLLSGMHRNNHRVTQFMLETKTDGVWTKVSGASVKEDTSATVDDGMISLTQNPQDITVMFDQTDLTDALRLTVAQADLGAINNMVITEVIVPGNEKT